MLQQLLVKSGFRDDLNITVLRLDFTNSFRLVFLDSIKNITSAVSVPIVLAFYM